jgi:hypothetical protein
MAETPARRNAPVDCAGEGGPQLRREIAQAAASLELSELDTRNAHVGEWFEITIAHGRDRDRPYSIQELHAMAEGELPDFPSAPGPEALKVLRRVSAKCSLRDRYGLLHHPCAQEQSGCRCLDEALEQVLDEGGGVKRRLRSLARGAHFPPPVYPPKRAQALTPPPQEALAEPQETNGHVEDPRPEPRLEQKPEPPGRVVHRSPRWFDASERPRFEDMTF